MRISPLNPSYLLCPDFKMKTLYPAEFTGIIGYQDRVQCESMSCDHDIQERSVCLVFQSWRELRRTAKSPIRRRDGFQIKICDAYAAGNVRFESIYIA